MRLYTLNGKCNIAGDRVREARQAAGLSQNDLAREIQLRGLQMEQMAVSRIETGKRVVADFELPIFSSALDVTVEWLIAIE